MHISLENRIILDSVDDESTTFKNHFFDFPNLRKSHHVCKRDITTGIQSLRCINSIRTKFYKTDDSQILPEVRAGNKPKGFVL